jgi:hypothetical protein
MTPSCRGRAHHGERQRLDEDAADQVLLVPAALHADGPTEHVREQQREHEWLHRDLGQLLGDLADVFKVASCEYERVGEGACAHADTSCAGAGDEAVSVRKTSSRVT